MELVQGNQFASGGLLVVVFGAVLAYLRSVPAYLKSSFLRNFTNKVSFLNTNGSFEWVERWFSANYSPKFGSYMVNEDVKSDYIARVIGSSRNKTEAKYYLAPNYGWYFKFYKGRLITINKISEKGGGNDARIRDRIDIRIFGSKKILEMFLEDIRQEFLKSRQEGMSIYSLNAFGEWEKQSCRVYVNKPILPDGVYESIYNSVTRFYSSINVYREKGILYKLGFMLHGVPGTGKTSTIASIAFDVGKDVYIMDMSSGIGNAAFISAVSSVPSTAMLVLEDLDCYAGTQKRVKEDDDDKDSNETKTLSLSTILNTLDGFSTPFGLVFFLTTNHKDKLDPALIRPGRIDKSVEFKSPSAKEVKELFVRLTGNEEGFEDFYNKQEISSMAQAQGLIIENYDVGL